MSSTSFNKIQKSKHYVLVAVDIGSSASCFAYMIVDETTRENINYPNIILNDNWDETGLSYQSKTPSFILVDKQNIFKSFGYEAIIDYESLPDESIRNHRLLNINELGNIKDIATKENIVYKICDSFKSTLQRNMSHRQISCKRFKWIILTPHSMQRAIRKLFHKNAKKFSNVVRKPKIFSVEKVHAAAESACSEVSLHAIQNMIVIRAGGSGVQVVLFRERKVKEVDTIEFGGMDIDHKFEEFICECTSPKFVDDFKDRYPKVWLRMQLNFRKAKTVTANNRNYIAINLSNLFCQEYNKQSNNSLQERYVDNILYKNSLDTYKDIFNRIIDTTQRIYNTNSERKQVILVGGIANNPTLRLKLEKRLEEHVIVLSAPETASVKGALLLHFNKRYSVSKTLVSNSLATSKCKLPKQGKLHVQPLEHSSHVNRKSKRKKKGLGHSIRKSFSIGNKTYAIQQSMQSKF